MKRIIICICLYLTPFLATAQPKQVIVKNKPGQAKKQTVKPQQPLADTVKASVDPVKSLIEFSGVKEKTRQYELQGQELARKRKSDFEDDVSFNLFCKDAAKLFKADTFYNKVYRKLTQTMSADSIRKLATQFSSKDYKKIRDMDGGASDPQLTDKMMKYMAEFRKKPNKLRLHLAEEYDQATHSTANTMHLVRNTNDALNRLINSYLAPEQQLNDGQLSRAADTYATPVTESNLRLTNQMAFLYLYRNATDQTLIGLVAFWKSPNTAIFSKAYSEAFDEGLRDAVLRANGI